MSKRIKNFKIIFIKIKGEITHLSGSAVLKSPILPSQNQVALPTRNRNMY